MVHQGYFFAGLAGVPTLTRVAPHASVLRNVSRGGGGGIFLSPISLCDTFFILKKKKKLNFKNL
jgi:hypothetical protein